MSEPNTTIIEINGIKLEIDLRTATRTDTFRIGQNVKVLVKDYQAYASYPGVIVGFDNFKNLPTITICYIKTGYSPEVKFAYITSETKDIEFCHLSSSDVIDFSTATRYLDSQITAKESELADLRAKKQYFLDNYNKNFTSKRD